MRNERHRRAWRAILVFVLALAFTTLRSTTPEAGQSNDPYDLTWYTIDGGGETLSVGGEYTLGGTIGQPDAGARLAGGDYTLAGGFWADGVAEYRIYLPLVMRQAS